MEADPSPTTLPDPAPLKPRRRWRKFIAYSGILLVVLAIVTEALCRYYFPIADAASFLRIDYTRVNLFGLVEARKHKLCNVQVRWQSLPDGFEFGHTLNRNGFRGPDFSLDPDPARPRIIFIGDGFVEGCGAADADTTSEQFAKIAAGQRPVEAINLGIAGNDFFDYVRMARDGLDQLKPQALVLIVSVRNLPFIGPDSKPARPQPARLRASYLVPRAYHIARLWNAGEPLGGRNAAGPFAYFAPEGHALNSWTDREPPAHVAPEVLAATRQGNANPLNLGITSLLKDGLKYNFQISGGVKDHLKYIASLCGPSKVRLAVVYVPYLGAANAIYLPAQKKLGGVGFPPDARLDLDPYRSQQKHLAQVTKDLDTSFVDLTDAFIEAEKSARMFWPIDGHCTGAGYRLVAEHCARWWSGPDQ